MSTTTSLKTTSSNEDNITNCIEEFLSIPPLIGLFVLVSIKGRQVIGKTISIPSEKAELTKAVEKAAKIGYNLYWSVNQPDQALDKKPKKSDISTVRIVHVDIDPDLTNGYEKGRKALLDRVPELIKQYSPTLIIDSGNGIQLFWALPDPVTIEEGERYNLNALHAVGGDKGTHNADRIMRVPGSLNFPSETKLKKGYPKEPSQASILYLDKDAVFDRSLFPDVVPVQTAPMAKTPKASVSTVQSPMQQVVQNPLLKLYKEGWNRHLQRNQQLADNLKYSGKQEQGLDHSAFLMTVLLKLAFFFQRDPVQMREVFEATGFAKCTNIANKWNDPNHILHGEQYSDYHIKKAISLVSEVYDPYFSSDAHIMLYGNQDEVALLIGRRGFYDKWLHLVAIGKWYQWTGTHWKLDLKAGGFDTTRTEIRAAIQRMKDWVQWVLDNGSLTEDDQKALIAAANSASNHKREKRYISDIYSLLSKDDRCTGTPSQFDVDSHLLGTPIGTIDLRTSELIDSNPQDFISKQTVCEPVEGDPERWCQFLNEIFNGDQEIIDFIQRLCGYALTGSVKEEYLFFCYGSGANGKSKFLEVLTYIWNDYTTRIAPKTLLNKGHSEHPTEIAKLNGARLVLGSELPVGEVWDDQKLKELTGGDTLSGRFMRMDYFDFEPQHTLVLAGNHIPQMKHVGEAERRRFVLIPFNVTIPPEKRDPALGDKLKGEAGQILTWCIKGAGMYYKSGLQIPTSILDASKEYLDSEDIVGQFLKSQLVQVSGKEVELDNLKVAANDWFNSNNHSRVVDAKSLRKELKDRGNSIRRSGSKYYLKDYDLLS